MLLDSHQQPKTFQHLATEKTAVFLNLTHLVSFDLKVENVAINNHSLNLHVMCVCVVLYVVLVANRYL